ncbi:MAG: GDSL-type esterase/lipase family protein [Candidatus Bathyarchaeota archaeon]|nr:GDSL-type esterase/lipase family protein [Candidatus Bathyarchaeota archaeon]MDD4325289.1 GDSL-type esterase/lipase family protein [Candidatus Bathyarchaeota archaeon]MDI9576930.1 GDSL-type esterase/lipase family protein [Thermoproteota archaeon]MDT8781668.1 hypothetical protein [Candidatus Bathyarchaeota archaeon]NLD64973.1 hypothetical protein [Thermoproteota archaeon]
MDQLTKILAAVVIVLSVLLSVETYLLIMAETEIEQTQPIRVACVGDSITRGTEYTLYLWDLLGSDYIIGDFGVGGATATLNSESSYMNETALELAKQFQPDMVVIMLGTNDADSAFNDFEEEFISGYIELIVVFQSLPSEPIIWIVQPPPIFNSSSTLNNEVLVDRVIPNICKIANQTGSQLIDAYTPLINHPEYFIDGIHPKVSGAKIIANTVYSEIKTSISE